MFATKITMLSSLQKHTIAVSPELVTIHSLQQLAREQESQQNSSALVSVWRVVIEKGVLDGRAIQHDITSLYRPTLGWSLQQHLGRCY